MNILFVIDTYHTNNNGTSISAQRFAAELRNRGHNVSILCSDDQKTTEQHGENEHKFFVKEFVVHGFDSLIKKHGFQFASIEKDVIRQAVEWADIVHCFMPFALEIYTSRYAHSLGKPCTSAFHIQPENIWSSVSLGKVKWIQDASYYNLKKWYNTFRHVHVPSPFMGRTLEEHGFTSKIHVISNGIQSDFKYTKLPKEPQYEGKILIMMVGRLANEKRQDVIINAVPYSKYADKIQLIFAGKGPEYNKYLELGKKLKNQPQFVYLQKDELIHLLAQCDLYVHASDMESEAISCIEAFAMGLVPVIANSDVSATPQFALDGRSLFIPGNPKDLARAIDYWLDNPAEKAYMEKIYAKTAKRYSLENSVRMFEEMLQEEINDNQQAKK